LESTTQIKPRGRGLGIALIVLGVLASALILAGLGGVNGLQGFGALIAGVYCLVLIAWLIRVKPVTEEKPDVPALFAFPGGFGGMLALVLGVTVLAFILAAFVMGNGWMMATFSVLPAIAVLIGLRKEINRPILYCGLAVFAALVLVELLLQPDLGNGLLLALMMAPQAMAGAILLRRSGLTRFHLLDGKVLNAGKSFLWGCLLAVPPALLNIAMLQRQYLSEFDLNFDRWWKAFYALQPGINEEVWGRLFLLTLFYALLRPVSQTKPGRALAAAVIISVFIHGMAHFPMSMSNPVSAVFASVMYGIPLGLIFVKRDFESAVAYHFFIDFVRFGYTTILLATGR
jgi:hypothetical protein